MKKIENIVMTITTLGVLSMIYRLLLHIAINDIHVWYHWVYFTIASALVMFVSYVIASLVIQGWRQV